MYSFRYKSLNMCKILLITVIILIHLKENDMKPPVNAPSMKTKKFCVSVGSTLRARHRSCFLRPDTGPCRAGIIQWYFDAKAVRCYRFYWGGCQGNGNKFETRNECMDYCFLPAGGKPNERSRRPIFCTLAFDFGTCFGHYNRWYFDNFYETCRRRIYSGCGGNQNNFQTLKECVGNCLMGPNSTMRGHYQMTTCIPLDIPELQ